MKIEVIVHYPERDPEIYSVSPDRNLNEMVWALFQHYPSASRFDIQITPKTEEENAKNTRS